ncbi:MAG: 3-dehydroquinate synthase [Bacteroidota bacterium]
MLIRTKIGNINVKFSENLDFIKELWANNQNSIIVVGRNVYKLYKNNIFNGFSKKHIIILTLDEKTKNFSTVSHLANKLLKFSAKKNLKVISFGGGINQDVVGFTASTLYRGIRWIYIPTTLLSQADSAIGLKTSLNFKSYKNVLGTFYSPEDIIIDVSFLKTLKEIDYYSGLGEIIKLLLMDKNSMNKLEQIHTKLNKLISCRDNEILINIIKESMKIKLDYMIGDEKDYGKRNLLNYGHCFGHALESYSDYNIPHGTAIIFGIIFSNLVSFRKGWLNKNIFNYINKKILFPGIPFKILKIKKDYFNRDGILRKMMYDKKRTTKDLALVLPDNNLRMNKILDYNVDEYKSDYSEFYQCISSFIN